MNSTIRFLLVLHNHQPVGNFDGVFEQAYQDSYLPFLNVLDSYPNLRISLHTSGSLMEWLDEHHPEYVDRLAGLVATGRIEVVGGPFYEPILTMIPPRDRVGQIRRYTAWLEDRLGANVRGIWMPERVWEQSLTTDLVEAGIKYTMLDDFHFKNAGLREDQLAGYYITEDDGHVLSVFPGSERMRYLIPFADPQETIDELGRIAERHANPVVMFADDGEKFGTWPETKRHVYDNGWLRRFFDLLQANQHWIMTSTPQETLDNVPPVGKTYLPEGSYREMTEWVLPTERILQYEELRHELEHENRWAQVAQFVRGGYWRNFKSKYPESNEMYSRMMHVSRRLQAALDAGAHGPLIDRARQELYRGQCNCSYWHGAFGGIYLPHLRNAIFHHLIAADNLLDEAAGRDDAWVEATVADMNFDARQEVQLASDQLVAMIAPAQGGMLYELDVRSICHNLLATLARRPEAYHQKVMAGPSNAADGAASIHDRVVFKQEGLDKRLQYDSQPRKSLLDHFWDLNTTQQEMASGFAVEQGDFVVGAYETRVRRNPDRIQVQLTRQGSVDGTPIKVTKGVTLEAGSSQLEIAYLLEGMPAKSRWHFGVEFNFAGLPAGADDRYYFDSDGRRLGQLGEQLDLTDVRSLGAVDQWLGINVNLSINRPSGIWAFPVEAVSQSEGGFELVHQSILIQPHWIVEADVNGAWSVSMTLDIETPNHQRRRKQARAAAAR